MAVEVALFGPPRVLVDGRPLEVDTRKAVALLAYLCLAEHGRASRDALAAILWPERDREHARGALRRTLSVLRGGLGANRLEVDRSNVALVLEEFDVDVARFRALAREAPEEAAAVASGEFLEGFSLRDSPDFEDWQLATADALRRDLSTVLVAVIEASGDRPAAAVEAAERLVALDPLQERAQRMLIDAYARAGDRAAAIRQYRAFAALLDRELGVAPLPETTAFFEAIVQGRGVRPAVEPEPVPAPLPSLPFVGRDEDVDIILAAVDEAAEGGRFVVVEGEAGIGKSRLVEEAADVVRRAGRIVLTSRAHQDEAVLSFNLVVETLRLALRHDDVWLTGLSAAAASECGRILPEIALARPDAPPPAPLEGPGAQARLFDAIGEALALAVGGPKPGLVVFDDLQWADPSSLDAITYLVRRLEEHPVCVVAVWRSDEVPSGHRLRRLLGDARRAGSATHLQLDRLRAEDVALLTGAAGLDAHQSQRIYKDSEGLPLFVVEHLAAHASGAPDADTVDAVIAARLQPLEELERQIAAAAAVLGRSFDPDLVRHVAGRGEEEVVVALERLTARGIVRELVDDGRYDFSHDRIRTHVHEHTALARRRLLHRRAAEALARGPGAPGRSASVALHYEQAGRDAEAAEAYVAAGDAARSLFANEEAIRNYERALGLGAPELARVHEALGDLNTLVGRYDKALSHYDAAAGHGAPPARIEHKIGRVRLRLGDYDLARSHFGIALDVAADASLRAHILTDSGLAAHHANDRRAAADDARRALELAEEAGDIEATARAHNVLGILAGDDRDTARRHLEQALALADDLDDPAPAVAALNNLALVQRAEGHVEDALALTEQALARCLRHGDLHRAAALHNNAADCLHALGRRDEALDHLKKAASLFARVGDEELRPAIWKLVDW